MAVEAGELGSRCPGTSGLSCHSRVMHRRVNHPTAGRGRHAMEEHTGRRRVGREGEKISVLREAGEIPITLVVRLQHPRSPAVTAMGRR